MNENNSMLNGRRNDSVRDFLIMLLKGFFVGLIIVLPGMSGGTLILVLGLYEQMMKDISHVRLLPWIPFIIGLVLGLMAGAFVFTYLLATYASMIMAVLLGCVLASARSVVRGSPKPRFTGLLAAAAGFVIGLILAEFSHFSYENAADPSLPVLIIGAALAAAAMILPGVPGSSILIMMGIYDDIMRALGEADLKLIAIFAVGAVVGVFALSKAVDRLYARHRRILSWWFAGLIIGSAGLLIPDQITKPTLFLIMAVAGFAVVWLLEAKYGGHSADRQASDT